MRTTINIQEHILRRLKLEADRTGTTLTEYVNRALEAGLERLCPTPPPTPYELPICSLGEPTFDPDRALRHVADLEDEETIRKLFLRK